MLRILFANADQKKSEIYVQHMKSHFQVDSVYDGLAATRKFKLSRPSLIISDYNLPLLSGISLLKFVRKYADQNITPFIFLSDFPDNTEALNFGAHDWLESANCQPDYLLDRIYHHLRANRDTNIRMRTNYTNY